MAKEDKVKASVKLTNGTVTLDDKGTTLLNAEVETRATWYSLFTGGVPRKPYTPQQRAASRAHEKAKAALTGHVGGLNFKDTCTMIGYSPQYAPRARLA